jgi:hypothetical protein
VGYPVGSASSASRAITTLSLITATKWQWTGPVRMSGLQDPRRIFVILSRRVGHQEPEDTWSRKFQTGWNPRRNPRNIPQTGRLRTSSRSPPSCQE